MYVFRFFIFLFFISFSSFSEEFKFNKIKFYGLSYFSEEFVFDKIVNNNSYMNENIFFKSLSDLNIFNKIEAYWNNDELKVFLVEKPIINAVNLYTDNDRDYILSLLNKLDLYRGNFYDLNKLFVLKKNIEEFYKFAGFIDACVVFSVDFNQDFGIVDINIKVSRQLVVCIKNIDIIGVNSFSNAKLISLLSYSKSNWMSFFLKDNIFFSDIVENDIDLLRSFYLDRGYSDFQVDFIRVFLLRKSGDVEILLNIFEGERYNIDSVDLVGEKIIFKNNLLYNSFKELLFSFLRVGDFFSRQKLIDAKTKLKEFLIYNDIADIEINFMVFYSGEGKIKIEFILTKQIKSRIRHINFVGNFLTCDSVLRRMLPMFEGSLLSIDDIEFGKDEIIRNGISEHVNIEYVKNPDDLHEVDVIYLIDEQKFGKLTAGLSYGNDDGFSVNFNSELSNFLGLGSDISLDINNNGIESDFGFTYYTPYFLGDNFGIGYTIYYKSDLFDQDVDDFDILSETFGAYLYYSLDFGKFEKFNFGFGCDMTFLGMYDEASSNEIRSFVEKMGFDFKEYFFNLIWTYNSLDKFYYPTSGFYQTFNFRVNIPGSKSKYYTINYDLNYYNNFYDDYIFNISSCLYYGNVYDDNEEFPFFKNFHIKGTSNIRGFKERSLGPQDSNDDSIGGNFLICSKFSLFLPTPLPDEFRDIKTALFFDIGNVYNTFNFVDEGLKSKIYYYIGALKFSLGISFLWSTPFGLPLEISFAYPFNVDDEESKSILSISFG